MVKFKSRGLRTRHPDGQGQEQMDISSSKKQVYPSFIFEATLSGLDDIHLLC